MMDTRTLTTRPPVLFAILLAAGLLFWGALPSKASVSGSAVVSTARGLSGTPYQWGGNGPGSFDCSGFVNYVYRQHGISGMPRVSVDIQRWATTIPRSQAQPGDLVFERFGWRNGSGADHVGIYVGNGRIIAASSSQGVVTERAIVDRAFQNIGRVPGVNTGSSSSSSGSSSGEWSHSAVASVNRAEAARIFADVLELDDQLNPFGVRTEGGAVGAVHAEGIAYPYSDGLFRPLNDLTEYQLNIWLKRSDATRAEAAAIVAGVLELDDRPYKFGVTTHGGSVAALNEAGIAYPYADGLFRPHRAITNAQVDLWMGRM